MPTQRPRHTITETGDVAVAFQRVRALGVTPDPKQLVVLGAERLVEDAQREHDEDDRRRCLREELLRSTLDGSVNTEAALAAHERGWTHLGDDIT